MIVGHRWRDPSPGDPCFVSVDGYKFLAENIIYEDDIFEDIYWMGTNSSAGRPFAGDFHRTIDYTARTFNVICFTWNFLTVSSSSLFSPSSFASSNYPFRRE